MNAKKGIKATVGCMVGYMNCCVLVNVSLVEVVGGSFIIQ